MNNEEKILRLLENHSTILKTLVVGQNLTKQQFDDLGRV